LLLKGVSPKEIAHKLNITVHTVAYHRTKLYDKLGVQSIKELSAKYSINGKEPPPEALEAEATTLVSPAKKKLKVLLPAGIAALAFSVLLVLTMTLNRKPTADTTPKGEIIPIHNIGFLTLDDRKDYGGSSTIEINIITEEINGVTIDTLNIKSNLEKNNKTPEQVFAMAYTQKHDIIQRVRQANGIRFKARGDGKMWAVEFQTAESIKEREFACYTYTIDTIRDQVIVADVSFSSLYLPEYWEQYYFDFNCKTIKQLSITATFFQGYGSASLQIFDFEIY